MLLLSSLSLLPHKGRGFLSNVLKPSCIHVLARLGGAAAAASKKQLSSSFPQPNHQQVPSAVRHRLPHDTSPATPSPTRRIVDPAPSSDFQYQPHRVHLDKASAQGIPNLHLRQLKAEKAMDAKEIELRGKAIGKAIQENEPSASVIKLLNDLKTGVHATEDILRSTRIGVTINRLRTHKNPSVQKLATELVSKWRDEVKKQPKKGTPAKVASATNGSASPAPVSSAAASPAPSQSKQKHTVDPAKRNHKTDKIKYEVTGEEARDMSVRLMYDGLAHMSTERESKLTQTRCKTY